MGVMIAAYIPYEQNERYSYGSKGGTGFPAACLLIIVLAVVCVWVFKRRK